MNKEKSMIRILLVGFGCVVLIAMWCIIQNREPVVIHKIIMISDPNYVMNPFEAQERLKAQGLYDGKIDGLWGERTDRAYCDYCAIRAMKRMEKK